MSPQPRPSVEYLTLDSLLSVAERAIDGDVLVRDVGLLESALARPRTTVFGNDAYPTLPLKAAALLHSLTCNHALVDGNKLAFLGTAVFLHLNGLRSDATEDELFDLVIAIADGSLADVEAIAARLRTVPVEP